MQNRWVPSLSRLKTMASRNGTGRLLVREKRITRKVAECSGLMNPSPQRVAGRRNLLLLREHPWERRDREARKWLAKRRLLLKGNLQRRRSNLQRRSSSLGVDVPSVDLSIARLAARFH